jgi:hypothetical protein
LSPIAWPYARFRTVLHAPQRGPAIAWPASLPPARGPVPGSRSRGCGSCRRRVQAGRMAKKKTEGIARDPNGKGTYTAPDGTRKHPKSVRRRDAAKHWRREQLHKLDRGTYVEPARVTVGELLEAASTRSRSSGSSGQHGLLVPTFRRRVRQPGKSGHGAPRTSGPGSSASSTPICSTTDARGRAAVGRPA